MNEEQTTEEVETVASEAASTTETTTVATKTKEQPKGSDFLNFDDFPTEIRAVIEPRFRQIYAHMKENERKLSDKEITLAEFRRHNADLEMKLDQLASKVEKSETVTAQRQATGEVAALRTAYKEALEAHDYDRVAQINEKLVEAKARELVAKAPKPEVKPEPKKPNGHDPNEAIIQAWADERDDDGNLKRPWTQAGHKKQARAAALVESYLLDPDWNTKPLPDILAEVEREMMPAAARTAATVLSPTGSLGPPRGDRLPGLSQDQKNVAEKMFPSLAAKAAHEKYAKQLKVLGKA